MTTAIALLRAVNVGGAGRLTMDDLRSLFEALGLRAVRTLLQTGNIVFETDRPIDAHLEAQLEAQALQSLGLATDFFVRPLKQWREVLAVNPFSREAEADPSHLVLVALKGVPGPSDLEALRTAIRGRERIEAIGDVLFVVYPDGIGRSKLTLPLIEKKLGLRGTGRNWNTAVKLAEIAGG